MIKVIAGESHGIQNKIYTGPPFMHLDFHMEMINIHKEQYTGDDEFVRKACHALTFREEDTDTVKMQTKDKSASCEIIFSLDANEAALFATKKIVRAFR